MPFNKPGTFVRHYCIERIIGHGGFGAVYKAQDTKRGYFVALKETFDPENIRRFEREFNVVQSLRHLNLPLYHEMFDDQGSGYLVMELISGANLQTLLNQQPGVPLPEKNVLGYANQLCDALEHLHRQSPPVIHRDIKPANILLTPEQVIKLVDFGLVKQLGTSTSHIALTPPYALPEQWPGRGNTEQRSDIYSLGATLYHLLTAHEPLNAQERTQQPPTPLLPPQRINPNVSQRVSDAVMTAMQLHPDERYPCVAAFKHALTGYYSPAQSVGQSTSPAPAQSPVSQTTIPIPVQPQSQGAPPPVTVLPQPPRQTTWLPWALGGGVVVVLVLALLVVLLALPDRGEPDTASVPEAAAVVVVTATPSPVPTDTPSPVPTDTPSPTLIPPIATPINPLFPVTLDEWHNEIAQRGTELTRDGDHYWRYVPGGTYAIGGWTDDDLNNNNEQADIELSSYWIARFPVTNQQYRQFIEASGYDTRAYWTDNGWAWKEAYNNGSGRTQSYWWDNERFNSDNQPVVGVWRYEAMAFAAWLNTELADSLPDGMQVRLPTEAEWEAACAYDANGQRHTYPWGEDEPTRDLADFDDGSDPDRAALVGERPAGAAASGAQDMVGSVWEFTTSEYDTFPATSGEVVGDFDTSTYVPLRGGSWWNDRTYVRCAARGGRLHVDDGSDGVRLLLLPPR